MNDQKQTSSQPERVYDNADNTVVVNASNCTHKFVMKGFRVCECQRCGMGLFVDSIDDFKKITKLYGND